MARLLLEFDISVHYEILPLVDFTLDGAKASSTAEEWLHDDVSCTTADAMIFPEHQLAQSRYRQRLCRRLECILILPYFAPDLAELLVFQEHLDLHQLVRVGYWLAARGDVLHNVQPVLHEDHYILLGILNDRD